MAADRVTTEAPALTPEEKRAQIAKAITARVKTDPVQQYNRVLKDALAEQELVEPTPDEARNGWTAETLTAYLAEQKAAQQLRIDPHSPMRRTRPQRANSGLTWGRKPRWAR